MFLPHNQILRFQKILDEILATFFIAKIPNKRELQQIAINYLSGINTKDFTNIYWECTAEPYSVLVNDTTLSSMNPLRFRKNLFNIYNKNHYN